MAKFAIGVDFGTELGRAIIVDVADGREIAAAVHVYANGVIDEKLPGTGYPAGAGLGAAGPQRLSRGLQARRPGGAARQRRRTGGCDRHRASTLPPVPCCRPTPTARRCAFCPIGAGQPHAWVKLWKHHAAQPEANQLNQIAARKRVYVPGALRRQDQLRSGSFPRPGRSWTRRRTCMPPPTGCWKRPTGSSGSSPASKRATSVPPATKRCGPNATAFRLMRSSPRSIHGWSISSTRRCRATLLPLGAKAGGLSRAGSRMDRPQTGHARRRCQCRCARGRARCHGARAGRNGDHHGHLELPHGARQRGDATCRASAAGWRTALSPACRATRPASRAWATASPGSWKTACRPSTTRAAEAAGQNIHSYLEAKAAQLKPGQSGLLALDWWNGNRTILVDADLSGVLLGVTLATRPEESTAR